jgi:hypothetical protein
MLAENEPVTRIGQASLGTDMLIRAIRELCGASLAPFIQFQQPLR